jgi:hypothetical protein
VQVQLLTASQALSLRMCAPVLHAMRAGEAGQPTEFRTASAAADLAMLAFPGIVVDFGCRIFYWVRRGEAQTEACRRRCRAFATELALDISPAADPVELVRGGP